jgi:hypothetical protein
MCFVLQFLLCLTSTKKRKSHEIHCYEFIERYTLKRESNVQSIDSRQESTIPKSHSLYHLLITLNVHCLQEHSRRCLFYIFKYCGGKDANYFRQNNIQPVPVPDFGRKKINYIYTHT